MGHEVGVNIEALRDLTCLLSRQLIPRNQLLHQVSEVLPLMFGAAHCVAVDWSVAAGAPRRLRPCDVFFEGWPEGYAQFYHEHFRERDPISSWLASGEAHDVEAVPLSVLIPHRTLVRRRFYKDLLQPFGLNHVLTLVIHDDGDLVADFSVVRCVHSDDFGPSDLAVAKAIHPVLAKMLQKEEHSRLSTEISVSHQISTKVVTTASLLTPREEDVVTLVARGMSNKHVARQLNVSPSTIKNHLKSVFRKCEIINRTELSRFAMEAGIVGMSQR